MVNVLRYGVHKISNFPRSAEYVIDSLMYAVSDGNIGSVSLSFQTVRMELSNTTNEMSAGKRGRHENLIVV